MSQIAGLDPLFWPMVITACPLSIAPPTPLCSLRVQQQWRQGLNVQHRRSLSLSTSSLLGGCPPRWELQDPGQQASPLPQKGSCRTAVVRLPAFHGSHSTVSLLPTSQYYFYLTLTRAFHFLDTTARIFGSSSLHVHSAFLSPYRTRLKAVCRRLDRQNIFHIFPYLSTAAHFVEAIYFLRFAISFHAFCSISLLRGT